MRIVEGITGTVAGTYANLACISYLNLKAGETVETHEHPYDHISFLMTGRAIISVDGIPRLEAGAPNFFMIRKEHKHGIEALADGTSWICIHATRDIAGQPNETIIDDTLAHDPLAGVTA